MEHVFIYLQFVLVDHLQLLFSMSSKVRGSKMKVVAWKMYDDIQ